MNPIRVAILVLGVAAAGGAVFLAMSPKAPEPQAPAGAPTAAAPTPVAVDEVLVATRDLSAGHILAADDLRWQVWPKDGLAPFMIQKDDKAIGDLTGSIVRADFYAGEPVRREQLIKGANSGYLSAVLPSGKRAVAITIDMQGASSAGGFVLPNDRVDVIRTTKQQAMTNGAPEVISTDTLLTNIRVLAIGQNVQDKNGQTVVTGATATLELDPKEAETVILAERTGQLSLTLRSMLDAQNRDSVEAQERTTIIRYGVESDVSSR